MYKRNLIVTVFLIITALTITSCGSTGARKVASKQIINNVMTRDLNFSQGPNR